MTSPIEISAADARRLFLHRQALTDNPRRRCDPACLLDLIERLGFVQVDSISTVARAHHMILFARNQGYKPMHLTRLLERDRQLFEHWTHDAAIIPTQFFPYWRHRHARERDYLIERWRTWRDAGYEKILDGVLETVRTGGPVMSKDFKDDRTRESGGWWDWHHGKTALEYHWRTGNLAIAGRRGFQKVYDLTERVIPEPARSYTVDRRVFVDWACGAALDRLGIATAGEIARFWDHLSIAETAEWCKREHGAGELVTARVTGGPDGRGADAYARPDISETLKNMPDMPDRVRVVSPFDPAIRDRKRTQRLFGFDYRIEVFVPEPKRTYGYYVFPLLERDRLIGRIDMKRDTKRDALVVTGLWLEPGVRYGRGRRAKLEAELDRHRRFVGAADVEFAKDYQKSGDIGT